MWTETTANGKVKFREEYKDLYTDRWRRASVTLDRDTSQSRKLAAKLLREKIDKLINKPKNQSLTFSEVYDEWFERYKLTVKPQSVKRQIYFKKRVNEVISDDILLVKIDKKLIQKIVDNLYTFGDLSYDYVKKILSSIRRIFEYAIDQEYITSNPALHVKMIKKQKDKEQGLSKLRIKYLERDEVNLLLDYFKAHEKIYWIHGHIAEFQYWTGLRIGELLALQWKNFDGKSVKVEGTLTYTYDSNFKGVQFDKQMETKTAAGMRTVDLPEQALKVIDDMRRMHQINFNKVDSEQYIFCNMSQEPFNIATYNKALKTAALAAKIDKPVTSHIFRHSHVSLLAELNMPIKTIMERVGHADAATTLQIYNHVTEKSRVDLLNALNKI